MDRLFDRLGELLRSVLGAGEARGGAYDPADPDMRAAYEELDAYLRGDPFPRTQRPSAAAGGPGAARGGAEAIPEALREDFAALAVPFGADLKRVRGAYKSLLLKYHPDRFGGDAEKQRLATDVTQRLNGAYRRIEAFYRRRPRAAGKSPG